MNIVLVQEWLSLAPNLANLDPEWRVFGGYYGLPGLTLVEAEEDPRQDRRALSMPDQRLDSLQEPQV